MGQLISVFTMLFALFPAWFSLSVLGFLAFGLVIIIIKIVGFILDAVPFL